MQVATLLATGLAWCLPACSPDGGRSPAGLHADRVLVNGNILTVDADDSVAQALAIRDGRIVAVGTNDEIEALVGTGTERIDLQGLTATPGLLDIHCHFANGGLSSADVDAEKRCYCDTSRMNRLSLKCAHRLHGTPFHMSAYIGDPTRNSRA